MNQPEPPWDGDPAAVLLYHAQALNARAWRWPLLGPSYHLLADALFWLDEAPPWSRLRRAQNALRLLWHYRTGLILGEDRPGAEYWNLGKRLFPRWVGFHPSRSEPLRRYLVIYRAGRMATARCIGDSEREVEEA